MVSDEKEINKIFTQFYTTLYKSEAPSDTTFMYNFLDNLVFPGIDYTTTNRLDDPLSLDELLVCLKSMQNGKAPGPDGFPVEFLKKFSDHLAPLMLDMFNDSLENGALPPSSTQASISLLAKPNKNLEECNSWRPISLLNFDVKLLAKILANRLDSCLSKIISDDQIGFIRARQLSSNIRRLLNITLSEPNKTAAEMVISMDALTG